MFQAAWAGNNACEEIFRPQIHFSNQKVYSLNSAIHKVSSKLDWVFGFTIEDTLPGLKGRKNALNSLLRSEIEKFYARSSTNDLSVISVDVHPLQRKGRALLEVELLVDVSSGKVVFLQIEVSTRDLNIVKVSEQSSKASLGLPLEELANLNLTAIRQQAFDDAVHDFNSVYGSFREIYVNGSFHLVERQARDITESNTKVLNVYRIGLNRLAYEIEISIPGQSLNERTLSTRSIYVQTQGQRPVRVQ